MIWGVFTRRIANKKQPTRLFQIAVLYCFDSFDKKISAMECIFSKAAQTALLKMYSTTDAYLLIWRMIYRKVLLKNTLRRAAFQRRHWDQCFMFLFNIETINQIVCKRNLWKINSTHSTGCQIYIQKAYHFESYHYALI